MGVGGGGGGGVGGENKRWGVETGGGDDSEERSVMEEENINGGPVSMPTSPDFRDKEESNKGGISRLQPYTTHCARSPISASVAQDVKHCGSPLYT